MKLKSLSISFSAIDSFKYAKVELSTVLDNPEIPTLKASFSF